MDSTLLSSIMCKNKSEHSNPSMQHYENSTGTSCVNSSIMERQPVHPCWFNFSRVKESRSRNSMKIQVDSGYTIIQKCFVVQKSDSRIPYLYIPTASWYFRSADGIVRTNYPVILAPSLRSWFFKKCPVGWGSRWKNKKARCTLN